MIFNTIVVVSLGYTRDGNTCIKWLDQNTDELIDNCTGLTNSTTSTEVETTLLTTTQLTTILRADAGSCYRF